MKNINNFPELGEYSDTGNIDRRDFIKLKFMTIFWLYFSQFFGSNMLEQPKEKLDYSILDEVLKLPFKNNEIKEEIVSRVTLQKKYGYDLNGNFLSLKRFFNEIGNFIISKNGFKDFKLLNTLHHESIDKIYYLNKAAQHNDTKILKYIQKKLVSYDSSVLNDALLHAMRSQSFNTTLQLMNSKIKLSEKTKDSITKLFYQEEYNVFYTQLSNTTGKLLLPSSKKYSFIKQKRRIKKEDLFFSGLNSIDEFESNLFKIVHNAMTDLYYKEIIDDFTVEKFENKVSVSTWNHKNIYPINFFQLVEETLDTNGFSGLDEYIKVSKSLDLDAVDYKERILIKGRRYYRDDDSSYETKGLDYSDFINIEVL